MNTHTEPGDKSCIPPQQTTTRGIRCAYLPPFNILQYVYALYVKISFPYTLAHRVQVDLDAQDGPWSFSGSDSGQDVCVYYYDRYRKRSRSCRSCICSVCVSAKNDKVESTLGILFLP